MSEQSSWDYYYYSAIPGALRDWYMKQNPAKVMTRNRWGGVTPVAQPPVAQTPTLPAPPKGPSTRAVRTEPQTPAYTLHPDPPVATAVRGSPPPQAAPTPSISGMDPRWLDLERQKQDREAQVLAGSMGLAGIDDERAVLADQMAIADELRNSELGPMRQAGRVNVASNPLEAIAVLGSKYYGNERRKKVEGETKDLNERRRKGLQKLMEAVAGMNREDKYPPPTL